jgi:hypothetical protein
MANRDEVKGAEPKGPCLRAQRYIAAGTIYPGDFVKKDAAGKVAQAAASDALLGVALDYAVADGNVLIADHPDQLFVVQADDDTVNAQTDIGLNYDITVAAGNATYKRSGMELDASTQATTATLPLRLVRIEPSVDNALGAQVKCVVLINNHQNGSHTGTAGV